MTLTALLLSSIGGASLTLFVNSIIKKIDYNKKVANQTKVLIRFIEFVVIRNLELNRNEYQNLLASIESGEYLFDGREITNTPMLNKEILNLFSREDMVSIFSKNEVYTFEIFYSDCYGIEFIQKFSSQILFQNFQDLIYDNFLEDLKVQPALTLRNYVQLSDYYDHHLRNLRLELANHLGTTIELIIGFERLKDELTNVLKLEQDDFE